MLILSRRLGETLRIGDSIAVTVLGVRGGQVRLGVVAPKSIPVHREEVYERIARESGRPAPTANSAISGPTERISLKSKPPLSP